MPRPSSSLIAVGACLAIAGQVAVAGNPGQRQDSLQPLPNASGDAQTVSVTGRINRNNPFFQSLGTNDRACVDCHEPGEGWSITPAGIQERFKATNGRHPLFRLVDGGNTPTSVVDTLRDRRKAYSLLLSKGLIRVSMPVPANAEFHLAAVDDPYHYAHSGDVSMYRRPLPSANLRFVSAVMWDGRESMIAPDQPYALPDDLHFRTQSQSAVTGHAEGSAITEAQQQAMVDLQRNLFVAQCRDKDAGDLNAAGAKGGAQFLSRQLFHMGMNDSLAPDPSGEPSTPESFNLYRAWRNYPGHSRMAAARRSIARGEQLFNTRPLTLSGVSGLNDELGVPTIQGTCSSCHNTPSSGNHSMRRPLDIGLTDEAERTPDLPLSTLERLDAQGQPTGEFKKTTDPGRAMVTGKWKDVARFKGPVLRGLAARAPYFHNGSAATLEDAVEFYNRRFGAAFTEQEKQDLAAFLRAL